MGLFKSNKTVETCQGKYLVRHRFSFDFWLILCPTPVILYQQPKHHVVPLETRTCSSEFSCCIK